MGMRLAWDGNEASMGMRLAWDGNEVSMGWG